MDKLQSLGISTDRFPCAACGSTRFELLATHDRHLLGLRTVGCNACGLLQTNPRPTEASLSHFYALHYREFYQGVKTPSEQYVASYNKDVRLRYTVEFLQRNLRLGTDSILLDYGCGEGSLFVALRQSGFEGQLAGVEPNESFGRFAAQTGRAVVHDRLEPFERFDYVVINHVLEHISDPVALLQSLATRLAPDGEVYVDVPDAEEYTHAGDLHIAHIFHFTTRTLTRLFQTAGYEIRLCEKHRPPNHPRSIRLVARRSAVAAVSQHTDASSETAAWTRMREIERTSWKWVIRKRLASTKVLRTAYRYLKSAHSGTERPNP